MRTSRWIIWMLALTLLAAGCDASRPLRVGAKSFDEQLILAEVASRLLKDAGWPVEPVVRCGDTYSCYDALRKGRIDVLLDYTGTGMVFQGQPIPAGDNVLAQLRTLYEPEGIHWLALLGFDNGYRVFVRTNTAQSLQLQSISDLARIQGGISVACPTEFLRRPLDGLQSLLSRYGLRLAGEPLVVEDPQERVAALLEGKARVAVLYATDGAILDPRIVGLEDNLDFFPPYEAAVLVRQATRKQYRGVDEVLSSLEGRISPEAMRQLNHAVQVEGLSPSAVALDFLLEEKLLSHPTQSGRRAPDILVSMHLNDQLAAFETRGLQAVREAFAGRTVVLKRSTQPVEDVVDGATRLALMGAERFFTVDDKGVLQREERIEAVAVLGNRAVHLLRRRDAGGDGLAGRVGIQREDSGAARVGRALLQLAGTQAAAQAPTPELIAAVQDGSLDAALILAEMGDAGIAEALATGEFVLADLTVEAVPHPAGAAPYLRSGRLPANTYQGQDKAVETWLSQVLLAAPRRQSEQLDSTGGPATALPAAGQPLAPSTVQALAGATAYHEAPDPVLPSAWTSAVPDPAGKRRASHLTDALLNAAVIFFLGWLIVMVVRRKSTPDTP